jgi:hypothetical protein
MSTLFQSCPCFRPAAAKSNLIPHVLRLLRNLHAGSILEDPDENRAALHFPLLCLFVFMLYDKRDTRELWKPSIDAEIVSVVCDLLALGDEPTVMKVLKASGRALVSGQPAKALRWAPGLTRAIAQLLTAGPPVAVREAAEILLHVARTRPHLIEDCHTWGIEASVQRLSMDNDPAVAAAADQLWKLLFSGKQDTEVRVPTMKDMHVSMTFSSCACARPLRI